MSRIKLYLTKVYYVITYRAMKGMGFLFIFLLVSSIVFTSAKASCHTEQSCDVTTISCDAELPSDGSSNNESGEHHCLFHCAHNVNLLFSSFTIGFQLPLQEPSFSLTHLISEPFITSQFRPPIA